MRPIPVLFHIGPLVVHTYGVGLAVTFIVGYFWFKRRLVAHGYAWTWLGDSVIWIVIASVVGARVVHVVANWSYYAAAPGQILQVWHGGLASFGGIGLAIPVGIYLKHRWAPEIPLSRALDLMTPMLVGAWALGRLLGPQLMVAGGGHPTNQWFGMYYADQVGKRLPVPLFQAAECFAILLLLWWVERRVDRAGGPAGAITGLGAGLWGLSRFFDEHLWLSYPGHAGAVAVQIAGLVMFAVGVGAAGVLFWRWRSRPRPTPDGRPDETVAEPAGTDAEAQRVEAQHHASSETRSLPSEPTVG